MTQSFLVTLIIDSLHFPRFVFLAGSSAAGIQRSCSNHNNCLVRRVKSVFTIETHTANERVQA